MSLSKDSALPLLKSCENWLDFSHLLLSLQHKRKKTNELEVTPNIYPCDIWHLCARRDGDRGHPLVSWPLSHAGPLPQSRDLVVWTRPPEGGGGMWDGGQAKSDGWWLHSPVWSCFERHQLNSQSWIREERRGHNHQQQEQIQMLWEKKVMKTEEKPNHWRLEEMQATAEGQHCTHDVLDQHLSPACHSWMLHDE